MQGVIQLVNKVALHATFDKRYRGLQQRTANGEPDLAMRPQAPFIKFGDLIERVVAPAMRVAAAAERLAQFAKRGAPRIRTQRCHQLRQGGDFLPPQ